MYKTRLNLIEPTKLLERVTVDNLTQLGTMSQTRYFVVGDSESTKARMGD